MLRRYVTIAFVEFGILYGASRLTLIAHYEYLSRILALGWECRPLGIPKELEGQLMGAMEVSITPATLRTVRMLFARGIHTPMLELEGLTRAA
jgi:acyl-homoserine lactone synthase